jgi:hypothetical protein
LGPDSGILARGLQCIGRTPWETMVMLQTAIVDAPVTSENYDDFVDTIQARDQRREVKIGDVISHYRSDDNEVEVTIWHNHRRAAVCYYNGDSEWGEWDESEQSITLDETDWDGSSVQVDRYGHPLR